METFARFRFTNPATPLELSLRSNALVRHVSRALVLQYSLYRVSDGETVSSHRWPIKVNSHGNCDPVTLNEPTPDTPGVYEIRCRIVKDDESIWTRLRRREPPIVRVARPILVLPKEPASQAITPPVWGEVGAIRPSESSWSVGQWLPKPATRLIPGSESLEIGSQSGEDLKSDKHAGESISLIQPKQTFQATLPVMTPGLPHKVVIRAPPRTGKNSRRRSHRQRTLPTGRFICVGERSPQR